MYRRDKNCSKQMWMSFNVEIQWKKKSTNLHDVSGFNIIVERIHSNNDFFRIIFLNIFGLFCCCCSWAALAKNRVHGIVKVTIAVTKPVCLAILAKCGVCVGDENGIKDQQRNNTQTHACPNKVINFGETF